MANNDNSDYPIGYKKPPRHTQFKPGESGNFKGRPRKAKTFADVLEKELGASIKIVEGGKRRTVTMREAIAKQHVNKAAGGDVRSTEMVLNATRQHQSDQEDNLGSLLQEFREKNARHVAADRERDRATVDDESNGSDD